MGIPGYHPMIHALRQRVEARFGKRLTVHADFVALSAEIEALQREHISESTLERVWQYSTRGCRTLSLRTLDVLAVYAGYTDWQAYCANNCLSDGTQSELFTCRAIYTEDLCIGDRLRIGWPPNRLCVIRYLGNNRFVAEDCENATMKEGDTFRCLQFQYGHPLLMQDFHRKTSDTCSRNYLVGRLDGLTRLEYISEEKHATNNNIPNQGTYND